MKKKQGRNIQKSRVSEELHLQFTNEIQTNQSLHSPLASSRQQRPQLEVISTKKVQCFANDNQPNPQKTGHQVL